MVRIWRGSKIWCLKLHGLTKIPDLPTIHNPIAPCRKKYIAREQPKVRRTRHPRMRCVEGQKIEAKRVLLKVRCAVHMVPYTLLSGLQGGGDPADRAAGHDTPTTVAGIASDELNRTAPSNQNCLAICPMLFVAK